MFFGTVERPPRLSEFELEIPEKLVAQHPSKQRDECKLMVLNKEEEIDLLNNLEKFSFSLKSSMAA